MSDEPNSLDKENQVSENPNQTQETSLVKDSGSDFADIFNPTNPTIDLDNNEQKIFLEANLKDEKETPLDQIISVIDQKVISTYGKNLATNLEGKKAQTKIKESFIVFSLADVKYALPINRVLEIGTMPGVTTIPKTPSWLLGVTNLRGDIFSVVDLKAFLALGQINSITARTMLVRKIDEEFSTILIVDKVNGLVSISLEEVNEPTAPIQSKVASYITGFYTDNENALALFDIDKLLNSTELRQFETVSY